MTKPTKEQRLKQRLIEALEMLESHKKAFESMHVNILAKDCDEMINKVKKELNIK